MNEESIIPPSFQEISSKNFSFTLNMAYTNPISFSQVNFGFLMAIASKNHVVILSDSKYIMAVLTEHEAEVCTVSFEINSRNLISCDVSGLCIFWHFQETEWIKSKSIQFKTPIISITWYSSTMFLAYSTKDGLFMSSIPNISENDVRLSKKSLFCSLNYNGSLLVSHSFGKTLTVFILSVQPYLTQILPHTSSISHFDFHPIQQMIMTYTKDGILRIWSLSSSIMVFSCIASISTAYPGFFLREPVIHLKKDLIPEKPTSIYFVLPNGEFRSIKLQNNGQISNPSVPSFSPTKKTKITIEISEFQRVYKTNKGLRAIFAGSDGIKILTVHKEESIKKELFTAFWVHTAPIINYKFERVSDNLFTRDLNGTLICWTLFSPYSHNFLVSRNSRFAAWKDSQTLIFLEDRLYTFNIETQEKSEFPIQNLPFPFSDLHSFFVQNNQLYLIGKDFVYTDKTIQISKYITYSYSKLFHDHFLLVFVDETGNFEAYICPEFFKAKVAYRSSKPNLDSFHISIMSLSQIVIYTNDSLEIWDFTCDQFQLSRTISLPKMKGIYCDTSSFGGRILLYDDFYVYSLADGIFPILKEKNITSIATSHIGHLLIISNSMFKVFPSWSLINETGTIQQKHQNNTSQRLKGTEMSVHVSSVPKEVKRVIQLQNNINNSQEVVHFLLSPYTCIKPKNSCIDTIRTTLINLLDFRAAYSLENCIPNQIPAIPNQYPIPDAFEITDKVIPSNQTQNLEFLEKMKKISIEEDIDLYGLRYIGAIEKSSWPPSFIGLFFSLSRSQSVIADYLITKIHINVSNLSKFLIPICIQKENRSLLIRIVKAALSNTWKSTHNVDNVALFYVCFGETFKLTKLYNSIGDNARADFFTHDFKVERWRKSANKNAYSSLSKQNFRMAAALFILAGELSTAMSILCEKLFDPVLGFLVLLLLDDNYPKKIEFAGRNLEKFISKVDWRDDTIPVIISLFNKDTSKAIALLKHLILTENFLLNNTLFGDRRISLYQIWSHLSHSNNLAPDLANRLNRDGLSPLSSYIFGLSDSPYDSIRPISSQKPINNFDEEEDSHSSTNQISSFNFGGADTYIDDISSDWSDSDTIPEPIDEIPKTSTKKDSISQLFENHHRNVTNSLCCFFGGSLFNEDSAEYALRFGYHSISYKLFNDFGRRMIKSHLSKYIDSCMMAYFESGSIGIDAPQLLSLGILLMRMLKNDFDSPIILSLDELSQLPHEGFSHSVISASFTVALWTYHHQLLLQVISKINDPIIITPNDLPSQRALFDADFSTPHFSDSLSQLLSFYSQGQHNVLSQILNLERNRLLMLILVFGIFLSSSAFFSDSKWQSLLLERYWTMSQSLSYYQAALDCETISVPDFSVIKSNTSKEIERLSLLMIRQHQQTSLTLDSINQRALHLLQYPRVCKAGLLSNEPQMFSSKFNHIVGVVVDPSSESAFCAGVATVDNLIRLKAELTNSVLSGNLACKVVAELQGITAAIQHPVLDVVMMIASEGPLIVSLEKGVIDISFGVKEVLTCAAFSPGGRKLALCGENLYVFHFSLQKKVVEPVFERKFGKKISCVAWADDESSLVLGLEGGDLLMVDYLTEYCLPVKKEGGDIGQIGIEYRSKMMVYTLKSGVAMICSLNRMCEPQSSVNLEAEPTCLACIRDMFVIGTKKGLVSFRLSESQQIFSVKMTLGLSSIGISDHIIAAVDEGNNIIVWNA